MERVVYDALCAAGDEAGAVLWRRLVRDLGGPLRVALVARERKAARRWALHTELPHAEPVPVVLGDDAPGLDLGSQDRLLSTHALLFLTPMTAPLGQADREALEALHAGGAPGARAVALMDGHLLARLSDDPEAEREAVYARVEALVPDGWPVLTATPAAWSETLERDLRDLRERRRLEVARFLLGHRLEELAGEEAQVRKALGALEAERGKEDEALAEARRRSRRLAAHTLAIVRRQTEQLELDLAGFLRDLEADLPAQIHALEDVDLARRTLPHWLSHVVETWMVDRLGRWRRDVLAELEELELPDAVGVDLVAPALQPAPVRGEARWADRLGTTAAFGGAAALLVLGLWIPGLVALAGGFALSTVFRGPSDAENRGKLVTTARLAVRQMGEDASRLLHDQLAALSDEIEDLAADDQASEEQQRRAAREELEERLAMAHASLGRVTTRTAHLREVLASLAGDTP
ncbi:MAG: hypothetical protein H6736_06450 [Alphaproteobacteria bacterium]|nr:hypothetical protein [Alphaproteobacteria bacterium]MCB9691435.1 hypothetical protein [Alphaproteobacteria bacterium]